MAKIVKMFTMQTMGDVHIDVFQLHSYFRKKTGLVPLLPKEA